MRIPWLALPEVEQRAFRTAHEFLSGRLMKREVLEWALRLGAHRQAERIAVSEVFQNTEQGIKEPWNSAWALLLESWEQTADPDNADSELFRVRTRIDRGDTSGQLMARIVDLVRPVIEIKPRSAYPDIDETPPRRKPRKVSDMVSLNISSGRLVDVVQLGLDNILDEGFLVELASGLDSALRSAFALGKRMGFDEGDWRFELPSRVYNVASADDEGEDPDEFHRGIPPVVKLLYAVVERLGQKNVSAARAIANSWRASALPIHGRLWNAIARDPDFATPAEVEAILSAASDANFWGMGRESEVSELRAVRFSSLSPTAQSDIERRVRKGPPRGFWRKGDKVRIREIQLYWAARELRRIQLGNGELSEGNYAWLAEQLAASEELREMQTVGHDFRRGPRFRRVHPKPDRLFDEIEGIERLDALELALATTDGVWDDSSASDWIREGENNRSLLQDLEAAPDFGAAYPEVWDKFGWAFAPHAPAEGEGMEAAAAEGRRDADRVFGLLIGLPLGTVAKAMRGIAALLDQWRGVAVEAELLVPVWQRLWPVAVDVTNSRQSIVSGAEQVADQDEAAEGERLDTLNNPAGKLYGVFSGLCPDVRPGESPFAANPELREMRDVMIESMGYAGLVVKYRMLEASEWFLAADADWTLKNLFLPLQIDSRENTILWGAIARRHHFKCVLSAIGMPMIDRAIDPKLSRDVRSALARSVVLEALHALNDERDPVIAFALTSQMVRSLEDEVRARVAGVIQKFASSMSRTDGKEGGAVEQIFNRSIRPFLETVWPQEAMLATPGVAKALADLPITCGEVFVDAVNAISHFLVPFDSWSMHEYGISCRGEGSNVGLINSPEKGAALLRLLDRTVGGADGTPIPYDLGEALEQVRNISPALTELPSYRRLATFTRR